MDCIAVFCALMWSSFYCHFGNSAADHVSAISDVAYNLNWFEYPVDMQKYVILLIARTKGRVEFSGLYLVTCSMEMLGRVCILPQPKVSAEHFIVQSFSILCLFRFSSSKRHALIMPFSGDCHNVDSRINSKNTASDISLSN